jgi:hypothetical protein
MRLNMKYRSLKLNRPRVSGLASCVLRGAGAGIEQDKISEGFLEHEHHIRMAHRVPRNQNDLF